MVQPISRQRRSVLLRTCLVVVKQHDDAPQLHEGLEGSDLPRFVGPIVT